MKNISIKGATWFYNDINPEKKETILLVHGHPFNHSMWKYQYETLSNFRLILPDLKGYGRSDSDFEKIYIEEQASDLAFLLDELEIHEVHLIGLSMGGQIIVEFQRLFPCKVKSLIVCASLPNAETKISHNNRLALAASIERTGMVEYAKSDIHKYINLTKNDETSDVFNHLLKMMSETTIKGAVASHRGRAERRDNNDYVKNIEVPTLLVAGEQDHFFDVQKVKQIADLIPNSKFKVVSGTGHLPNMENPETFNKLVLDFYNEIK